MRKLQRVTSKLNGQRELLELPWDAVLVMDAARWDIAQEITTGFRPVEALGGITHQWCTKLWSLCKEQQQWFTANPVVSWRLRGGAGHRAAHAVKNVTVHDIWRECWQEFGPHKVGSVHPDSVNEYVMKWVAEHGQPPRMVVFYLQPHTPYIASLLPARAGNIAGSPSEGHNVRIPDGVKKGLFTGEDVRHAYKENLRLVIPRAFSLASHLCGRVIITADHGEALGEVLEGTRRWGHAGVPSALIRQVPWMEFSNGRRPNGERKHPGSDKKVSARNAQRG